MSKVFVEDAEMQDIANAIREKNGTDTKYLPSEMANAIKAIVSGGGGSDDFENLIYDNIMPMLVGRFNGTLTSTSFDKTIPWQSAYFPVAISIGEHAFKNCASLEKVLFPSVFTICDYAFYSCKSLRFLNFPSVETIGKSAFGYCESLMTVALPSVITIDESAFELCRNLSAVNLPQATTIGERAFMQCSSIFDVIIPNVTVIGAKAFYFCDNNDFNYIYLPNIVSIGETAFYGCINLESFVLSSLAMCDMAVSAIMDTKIIDADGMPTGNGFVYVPTALYESYIADFIPKIVEFATANGVPMDEPTATYIATAILRKLEDYTVDGTITGELDMTKI